ncbi:RagB/SusD family nutrient uptake outer membrane protein [Abyssalbus ytuae]|uniref:RagB/SusD family nutrient uptake outer membrane protein n=1 Tax=Abyssalbus ytuae TaxID=2926907 RepID=A0A9E6ZL50_9FLAO|nr:RagB/SusD family nutrient uptake outer membrane protein [Abyssalbus ytuae]UOB17777.1 RagB/SusD family nutrient uptake outer membrane protein [Abyssalbus ytuae]
MKKVSLILITIISLGILSSCSDEFLEEEMVATLTQDRFNSEEGIEELVNGAYEGLRFHHAYEWGYTTTNYGVDTFTNGGGANRIQWNTYSSELNPLDGDNSTAVWNNMYAQINLCNIGISKIPDVLAEADPALKNTRLGELLFLRAFDYFKLVRQFGGVPISTEPIESDVAEFPRATKEAVYDLIVDDFTRAEQLLPDQPEQVGRITKAAAQHFLAKVYLTRASEINTDITQPNDLQNAADFAEKVIASRSLAPDYNDIFNYTAVNGPNETLSEVLLSSQFDDNQSLLGRFGNRIHLYFLSVYRFFPGMTRNVDDGREFQRLKPTDYAIDIFDRTNDSRYYKSFQTSYIAQNTNLVPVWTSENAPSPELVGQLKFMPGDTAVVHIANSETDNRFTPDFKDSFAPTMVVRYARDDSGQLSTDWNISTYPSLSKYRDPFRQSFNDEKGTRDGLLARLGETYLIAAEAYGRMGDYGKALTFINAIRERAAYKAGEDRGWVYYLAQNVPYGENTSTVGEMIATEDDFTPGTTNADLQMYPPGVGNKQEMFIHFILNERARELMGEFHRWEDLSRTKTLVQRATAFNPEAAPNINENHELRPIPQSYLDALESGGIPLTPDQKDEVQNPGY